MASNFIVNPNVVSQSQIYQALLLYVQSLPDYDQWKDFYASSAGTTLLQLLAGLGAYISYNVIVSRREAYLPYAQNYSSAVAEAETLGYSTYRGQNPIISINVTPNFTGLQKAFTVIGAVSAQSLVLLNDTTFNDGVPITIEAIVGNIVQESVTVQSPNPAQFRFSTGPVSETYQLYLNGTLVPTSERLLDMVNGIFAVLSNVLGSVDVNYLNLSGFTFQYTTNDVLMLQYILLANTTFTSSDVIYDFGTLNTFQLVSLYSPPETIQSIKVNAPLFNETQFTIRGRDDYEKVFMLLNDTIVDTSYFNVSPAVVDLCYATENCCLFTAAQLQDFITSLSAPQVLPMGLQPPTISDPLINFFSLNVVMNVSGTGSPTNDLATILQAYEQQLGGQIDLDQIISNLTKLNYVQIAKVSYASTTWVANTNYLLGSYVTPIAPNGMVYTASSFLYRSSGSQPIWPNTIGDTVVDGRILWTAIVCPNVTCPAGCISATPPAWQANHAYNNGDIIFANAICFQASQVNLSALPVANQFATGCYNGTCYQAGIPGTIGNNITLVFDGVSTNQIIVNNWNTNNPSNPVSITSGNPSDVSLAFTLALTGGTGATSASTGSYNSVVYQAQVLGVVGNSICLVFDGVNTNQTIVNNWNTAHPSNPVSIASGNPSTISTPFTLCLTGGTGVAIPATLTYNGTTYGAVLAGPNGNSINLVFNGTSNNNTIVGNWNTANPSNPVQITAGSGTAVSPAGSEDLSGGGVVTTNEPAWPGNLLPLC